MTFLAVEGGDGAGKGTVVAALAGHLHKQGHDVLTTNEPGGTPEGLTLRRLLLTTHDTGWDPWAELLLMTAARVQHVNHVIRPALAAGRLVLSDRFVGSTLAYQGAGRGLSIDAIADLHRHALDDIHPDLTIVLDLDPAIGIQRSRARLTRQASDEGRFEALDLPFHERVRASFLAQAAEHPERHAVIDASRPPAEVAIAVFNTVQEWHARRTPLSAT